MDRFVSIIELSETLGVHRQTLWRWHKEGRIPPMVHLGPSKRGWWQSTLERELPGYALRTEPQNKAENGERPNPD